MYNDLVQYRFSDLRASTRLQQQQMLTQSPQSTLDSRKRPCLPMHCLCRQPLFDGGCGSFGSCGNFGSGILPESRPRVVVPRRRLSSREQDRLESHFVRRHQRIICLLERISPNKTTHTTTTIPTTSLRALYSLLEDKTLLKRKGMVAL